MRSDKLLPFFTTLRPDISSRIMRRRQSGILPEDVEPPISGIHKNLPLSILYAVHARARLSYFGIIAVIGENSITSFVGYCVSDYACVQVWSHTVITLELIRNSISLLWKAGEQMTAGSHPAPLSGRTFRPMAHRQARFQK
jgi:hypothetical protein